MYLKWNLFKDYCTRNGIHLLKGDIKFIESVMLDIPVDRHRRILKSYSDLWLSVLKKEENVARSQNLARKTANTWLREAAHY